MKMRFIIFPLGARFDMPRDYQDTRLVKLFTTASRTRERLLQGTFDQNLPSNPVGHVNNVFIQSLELAPIYKKIRDAIKAEKLEKALGRTQIEIAQQANVITDTEAQQLFDFDVELMEVIHVDHFESNELSRTQVANPESITSQAA